MASPLGSDYHFINEYLTRESTDSSPLEACKLVMKKLEEEMESLIFQRNWLRAEVMRLTESKTGKSTERKSKPVPVARHKSDSVIPLPPVVTSAEGRLMRAGSLTGEDDVFGDQKNNQGRKERRQTWSHEGGSEKYRYLFVVKAIGTNYAERDGFFTFTKGQKFDVLEKTIPIDGDDDERLYRVRNIKGNIGKVEQLLFVRCTDSEPLLAQKPWYHGTVPEATVKERLKRQHPGCFLVKDSDSVIGSLEIVFRDTNEVSRVYVYAHASGYSVLSRKFKTLDGVIDFYQKIPISGSLVLTNPLLPKI